MSTNIVPAVSKTRAKQSDLELRGKMRKMDRLAQAQLRTCLSQKSPPSKFKLRAINGSLISVYLEGPTQGVKIVIGKTKETFRLGSAKRLLRILRYWNPAFPARTMRRLMPP